MMKWFLAHKDMSTKNKIDIAKNALIHKYETQEDSEHIKMIPKCSFLSLKTMSDRRFNTKYTLCDLYRQNGDIVKANQIAEKQQLLVFDNFYGKQTYTFSEPFYHNPF